MSAFSRCGRANVQTLSMRADCLAKILEFLDNGSGGVGHFGWHSVSYSIHIAHNLQKSENLEGKKYIINTIILINFQESM